MIDSYLAYFCNQIITFAKGTRNIITIDVFLVLIESVFIHSFWSYMYSILLPSHLLRFWFNINVVHGVTDKTPLVQTSNIFIINERLMQARLLYEMPQVQQCYHHTCILPCHKY